MTNAFNWQGQSSVFTDRTLTNVNHFNGVNSDKAVRMTNMEKKNITYAKGDFLDVPRTQVNAYSRAKPKQ